ncbi:MAG: trigger factor [Candidatus Hydrothermota bacterium]|nr:MAG: trigger factor [Candidatus Hydrothermae bacterium]
MKRLLMPDDKKAKRSLEIRVPKEKVDKIESEVVKKLAKKAVVPGFRPGKAPIDVIRLKYRDYIRSAVYEEIIEKYVAKEFEARNVKLIGDIVIKDFRKIKDGDISITVEYEAIPRFDLPDLDLISVKRVIPHVTLAEIDAEIEKMRRELAQFVPVDRPSQMGDLIIFDLEILDEKSGSIIQRHENRVIHLDANEMADSEMLPKFIGVSPGDVVEIRHSLEELTENGEKKKIPAILRYRIRSVGYLDLPPVDDELAKDLGFNDLNEMREKIREELVKRYRRMAEEEMEEEIVQKIMEAVQFEVPPSLVEQELKHIEAHLPKQDAIRLRDGLRAVAELRIAKYIIARQVIELLDIRVSDEEVKKEIERRSKEKGIESFEDYLEFLKRDEKEFRRTFLRIREQLLVQKAWDYIKSRVKMEVVIQ